MIKALSLAAALALLPLSAALAQDEPTASAQAEAELEAAAEAFGARMEAFAAQAEVIEADESLSEDERETAIEALWTQYEPAVAEFTAFATSQAGVLAAAAMAEIDVEALVHEALAEVDLSSLAGMASNGAWASQDPEHMATYGLMAEYALGQVEDAVDEAELHVASAPQASHD